MFLSLAIEALIKRAQSLEMAKLSIETSNRFIPELLVEQHFVLRKKGSTWEGAIDV